MLFYDVGMKVRFLIFVLPMILSSCEEPTGRRTPLSEMKLVFTRDNEIYLYDMINEELEKLIAVGDTIYTNELGYPFIRIWADEARWSPDSKEIVFVESWGTDVSNLKLLSIDSGDDHFLSDDRIIGGINPEWSTDGKKIIISKSIVHFGLNYEIFLVDTDGENETQITDRPYHADYNPTIHSNGFDILFGSSYNTGDDHSQIFHTTINGDTSLQVTFFDQPTGEPEFNPVTDDIIYRKKNDENSYSNIWKVSNINFTDPIQLTNSNYHKTHATWSNDGKLIVFTQLAGIDGPYSNPETWMMNADGSEQKMILKNSASPNLWIRK